MYVELHLHSNYSLLDGASHPEELVETAALLGYSALAMTDHDNLYGAMHWAHACKRQGIRPITGVELTTSADPAGETRHHLTLLAASREGYGNLCRLVSLARGLSLETARERERRRRDPCLPLHLLADHTSGIICLTGCREGELSTLAAAGRDRDAQAALQRWIDWFGRDNVYVELQNNLVRGDRQRNRTLANLASRTGAKLVATGNVHYHERSRHRLQDALVAIRHRTSLDASHRLRRPNSEFFLRPQHAQEKRFGEWPGAVASTLEIAQRCGFDLTEDLGYRLPSPPATAGLSPDQQLAHGCHTALLSKYSPAEQPAARARLEEELGLIARHGLAGFFLIYKEVLHLAEAVAEEIRGPNSPATGLPPGRGRGSSVGSIVCYLIGLSHIDPVRNRLFLGRFLKEEMPTLPDIDLDFSRDIRARLFERVYEHWGRDHAALVATFPTYRVRSAIRDLGRALGLPRREIDRLAKFSEGYGSAREIRTEMERHPQFATLVEAPGWRELVSLAPELAGFPRHFSQHVGGMVIASDPLIECVPIEPAAWPGRYVCHWDKDAVDDAGMVKIDFLGLGMLSLVEECLTSIAIHRGVSIDLSRIDFADERVYDRICEGDTIGVFQIESRAQAGMLPRSQPRNLEDLTAQVAIIRPGPIVGGAVHPYLEQREAMRRNPHHIPRMPHECLRPILAETLGVVLYQEQVVQVAMAMGGYSAGEADELRRAMGRRSWPQVAAGHEQRFMSGAQAQGVSPEIAAGVFQSLVGFADFGFPKSHSVAFGLLAYQSAWLKEYYQPEFYCALYNGWPMGFYPPHVVTNDARRHGVEILRPDINLSQPTCTVEGGQVRMGLNYVDGVGRQIAVTITGERTARGPYRSLFDCAHRTGIPRRAMEDLIRVGAFDSFGLNAREQIWQIGLFGEGMQKLVSSSGMRQLRLGLPTEQDEVSLADFTAYERMTADYALMGLSPDAHPLRFLRKALGGEVLSSSAMLALPPEVAVTTAGLVVCRQRPATAKGTVFLLLEDEEGLMNVVVTGRLYEQHRFLLRTSPLLLVDAVLQAPAGSIPMLRARHLGSLRPPDPLPAFADRSWC